MYKAVNDLLGGNLSECFVGNNRNYNLRPKSYININTNNKYQYYK